MSSPDTTMTEPDATVPVVKVRRSSRSLRMIGGLVAIVAIGIASTACTPEVIAKDAIAKYWGPYVACAERIVERESNFQAGAVNPSSGTTGLFQIHPVHADWIRATYGYSFSEMKDPFKNSRVAKGLSSQAYRYWGDGWQPWRLSGKVAPGAGCPA